MNMAGEGLSVFVGGGLRLSSRRCGFPYRRV